MATPRNSNNNSRCTVITDALAKPNNEREMAETISSLVNATRGSNGTGEWNGGIEDAVGNWVKYSMFWDAKCSFDATGSTVITFPYLVVDSVVKVYKCGTGTPIMVLYYLHDTKTLSLVGLNGKTIVEVSMVKNTKETI